MTVHAPPGGAARQASQRVEQPPLDGGRRRRAPVVGSLVRRRGERGGATVLAVACLGLLLVVAVALAEVGAWFAADRRVRAATDLAALAAAGEVTTDPCGVAASVAEANGAELVSCVVAGREVLVVTRIPAPSRWGPAAELTARARAGPA